MEVVIKACKGKNLATGKEETHSQYSVWVDGELVGYKSWNHGSRICLIGRVSPEDLKEIESSVDIIIGDGATGVMPLDRDEIETEEKTEEDHNDFDS